MLRVTVLRRRAPRPTIDVQRLSPVLARVGLPDLVWPSAPLVAIERLATPATAYKQELRASTGAAPEPHVLRPVPGGPRLHPINALAPLFSPHFVAEDRQYTALGDAVIAEHLNRVVFEYVAYRGLFVSANVVKQLVSCFHNSLALRYFAENIGLLDLANVDAREIERPGDAEATSGEDPAARADRRLRQVLDQLREKPVVPSYQDLAGTSYALDSHPFDPSIWGSRMSHFIGAIKLHVGDAEARTAVSHLWGLELGSAAEVNIPHRAAAMLEQLVAAYSAPVVAESVLAAQGITVSYGMRHMPAAAAPPPPAAAAARAASEPSTGSEFSYEAAVEKPTQTAPSATGGPGTARASATQADDLDAAVHANSGDVAAPTSSSAQPPHRDEDAAAVDIALRNFGVRPGDVTPLHTGLGASDALQSLAAGPGLVDLIGKFETHRRRQGDNAMVKPSDGWLTDNESSGPRGAGARFASVARGDAFFADIVGIPEPMQGRRVAAARPLSPKVRDEEFYALAAHKDGIPIDTNGLSTGDFVRSFRPGAPQPRVFEVSFVTHAPDGGDGVIAARAYHSRYTVARVQAASGYLQGVVVDLARLGTHTRPPA